MDTGTLQYDVFFNKDGSECIVHERYRGSDALLEHLANFGETATALFQICSAEGEVLGTPGAKLRKALGGGPSASSRRTNPSDSEWMVRSLLLQGPAAS